MLAPSDVLIVHFVFCFAIPHTPLEKPLAQRTNKLMSPRICASKDSYARGDHTFVHSDHNPLSQLPQLCV